MSKYDPMVSGAVPAFGADDETKSTSALRVLVFTSQVENPLPVRPAGPVSIQLCHTWPDVITVLKQAPVDVLAIDSPTEAFFETEGLSAALDAVSDLHVAIFGKVSLPVARAALRMGATGIMADQDPSRPADMALRMVAEGKFYVDSHLAGPLMDESAEAGPAETPFISLYDTVALVVDDDEYFRMAVARILFDSFGFAQVLEASNLYQAQQLIAGNTRIDLGLFDLDMPGMSGPSTLKGLRQDHPNIRKMAVVSGSTDRADVLETLSIGTHGFVSKLEGIPELKIAVSQILKGRVYAPSLLHEIELIADNDQDTSLASDDLAVMSLDAGVPSLPQNLDPEEIAQASRYVPQSDAAPVEEPTFTEVPDLSPRQRCVLELLVQGMSNKEIARELDLGIGTVKVHMTALFAKLGVSNRTSAVAVGARYLE